MQPTQRPCAALWRIVTISLAAALAASAVAQSVIVDNSDTGFQVLSGTWDTGTSAAGHWGANYRFRTTTGYGATLGEVEWRPSLPAAGAYQVAIYYPQGTNRANNAPFTVHYAGGSQTFLVNQQGNGGQWNVLGTFSFNAGTGGYVTLSNDANPNVVLADAVQFTGTSTTVYLTMAANPAGWGSTVPAVGGPYAKALNEVVSISATPAGGYEFHHWEVSAGSAVTAPASADTTVVMDQDKTVTAVFVEEQPVQPEFRAIWADAFHAGFKSTSEIDTMIAWALAGNYNAIIPEVLAFHDQTGSGHGAYWDSGIVPMATDISGGIDPLYELVQRAHAAGLEVHPWLVAYRVSAVWPPSGNPTVAAHPEWLMVRKADINLGALPVSDGNSGTTDYYTFDPGSPDAQEYLMGIVRELVAIYAIDGIHWDYIRYTQTDAGYPTSSSYTRSSLKRFQDITGYVGVPNATGVTSWNDFRRRTITEFVRRAMFEIPTIANPRQPLRHSAALVTWAPANIDFHQTGAYTLFCDWEYWQSLGYLDATVPMAYFDEGSYATTYRAWVDNSVTWATNYNRHTFIGPGIYLNTFAGSAAQLLYARNAGADGYSTYSYRGTNDAGATWSDWYAYVVDNVSPEPVPTPTMPWRDPVTATEGTVYGRVTLGATGTPVDNATIKVNGFGVVQTDGNGYYILTRQTADVAGTPYPLSAAYAGYTDAARPAVLVERAGFTEANFALGTWLPGDYDVDADVDWSDFTQIAAYLTGPDNGPPAAGGDLFDFDYDNDVDLPDLAVFQRSFTD